MSLVLHVRLVVVPLLHLLVQELLLVVLPVLLLFLCARSLAPGDAFSPLPNRRFSHIYKRDPIRP
jgi:hypothetical protein